MGNHESFFWLILGAKARPYPFPRTSPITFRENRGEISPRPQVLEPRLNLLEKFLEVVHEAFPILHMYIMPGFGQGYNFGRGKSLQDQRKMLAA